MAPEDCGISVLTRSGAAVEEERVQGLEGEPRRGAGSLPRVCLRFGKAGRSYSPAVFLSSPLRSMLYRGYFCGIIQSCPSPRFQLGAGRTVYFREVLIFVSGLNDRWWFSPSVPV